MKMTIHFGIGTTIEVFTVVEVLARWRDHRSEVDTLRVRLDRPYKGRSVIEMPADSFELLGRV